MDTSENTKEGPETSNGTDSADLYKELLQEYIPIYTSRLVRYGNIPFNVREQVTSPECVVGLLMEYFEDKDREEFIVLLLDTANTVIGIVLTSVGGLAASIVEPRTVFKAAILANAASIIVVHNHPSGNPNPSVEDIRISKQLVDAGQILGIPILDHMIIAESTYTSLAERGLV